MSEDGRLNPFLLAQNTENNPNCHYYLSASAVVIHYERRKRRFRIDIEVRCVGAHPPFWPLEPARVKPN